MNKTKLTVSLTSQEIAGLERYRIQLSQQSGRIISKQEMIKTALHPYLSIGMALCQVQEIGAEDGN